MKKSFILFYFILILSSLVSFKIYSAETVELCPGDFELISTDEKKYYCITCQSTISFDLFKITEMPLGIKFDESGIRSRYPDRIESMIFCEENDVIYVATEIIKTKEKKEIEKPVLKTNEIVDPDSGSGENNNSKISDDSSDKFSIYIVDLNNLYENYYLPLKKIYDELDHLGYQIQGKEPVSFIDRYLENNQLLDINNILNPAIIEPLKHQKEVLERYKQRKSDALALFSKNLINCGEGIDEKKYPCKEILNTTIDGVSLKDKFHVLKIFVLLELKGWKDNKNEKAPIVDELIKYFENKIKSIENTKTYDVHIEDIQTALQILGLYNFEPDGVTGTNTKVAIKKWRDQNGITSTGPIEKDSTDYQLLIHQSKEIIRSQGVPIIKDPTEENKIHLKEIQKALKILDFYHKNIDGTLGANTVNAINKWRAKHNLGNAGNIEKDSREYKLLMKQKDKRNNRNSKEVEIAILSQKALSYLDFDDGYFANNKFLKRWGRISQSALEKWQIANGYPKTGIFFDSDDTFLEEQYNKLIDQYKFKQTVDVERRNAIPLIQEYLIILGYYDKEYGKGDGPKTRKAIKNWEDQNNISQLNTLINNKGEINKVTLLKLKKDSQKIGEDVTDYNNELKNVFTKFTNTKTNKFDISVKKINAHFIKNNEFIDKIKENILLYKTSEIDEEIILENHLKKFEEQKNELTLSINTLNNHKIAIEELEIEFKNIQNEYSRITEKINTNDNDYLINTVFQQNKKSINLDKITTMISSIKIIIIKQETSNNETQILLEKIIPEIQSKINAPPWTLIIIGIILILVLSGGSVFWFIFQKSKKQQREEKTSIEIQQRKEKMEKETLEHDYIDLQKHMEQKVQEKIIEQKTIEEEKKILTPEEKEKKDIDDTINDYWDALRDVSFVENFQSKWKAVGLKESQILETNKARSLTIDTKTFSKCNFWALPFKNDYIVFAGRTLRSNVASLIADDNRWAKELFDGIYEIVSADEFFTKNWAVAKREGDLFMIKTMGKVQIPKRND